MHFEKTQYTTEKIFRCIFSSFTNLEINNEKKNKRNEYILLCIKNIVEKRSQDRNKIITTENKK